MKDKKSLKRKGSVETTTLLLYNQGGIDNDSMC